MTVIPGAARFETALPRSTMRVAKATDSKAKTLPAAVRLRRQQGYHGTALHDLLAAAGSPDRPVLLSLTHLLTTVEMRSL